MSTVEPEGFFARLVERGLARAKAPPALAKVTPLADRGWRLGFRVADGAKEFVEVNAVVRDDAEALSYSYLAPRGVSGRRARHLEHVGRLLCRALERVPPPEPLPPLVRDPSPEELADEERGREHLSLWLEGSCDRGCIFCSVSHKQPEPDPTLRLPTLHDSETFTQTPSMAAIEDKLRAGVDRAADICIEWSGKDTLLSPSFDAGLRLAYELGYRDMGVQTPGSRLIEPGFLEFLRDHSVARVALTAHAGDEATFDAVGGKPGAYRMFWQGFERLLDMGFEVTLEVPCIAKTVDGLPDHLAQLAAYPSPITCFYWYPSADMNDTFATIGVPFERAIEALDRTREQVAARRIAVDGIPECMRPARLREHFLWRYGGGHTSFLRFEPIAACEGCAARSRCPGPAPVYAQHYPVWPGTPLVDRDGRTST